LAWVAGYVPRWFAHPKTVTHPSTNRARRRVTSPRRHRNHKIYTSYFVAFQDSFLQLKCTWPGVFPKLGVGYRSRRFLILLFQPAKSAVQITFSPKTAPSHGGPSSNAWFLGPIRVPHPKRHLDRFSRFCAAQDCARFYLLIQFYDEVSSRIQMPSGPDSVFSMRHDVGGCPARRSANNGDSPAHVVQWSNHLGAMCSTA